MKVASGIKILSGPDVDGLVSHGEPFYAGTPTLVMKTRLSMILPASLYGWRKRMYGIQKPVCYTTMRGMKVNNKWANKEAGTSPHFWARPWAGIR